MEHANPENETKLRDAARSIGLAPELPRKRYIALWIVAVCIVLGGLARTTIEERKNAGFVYGSVDQVRWILLLNGLRSRSVTIVLDNGTTTTLRIRQRSASSLLPGDRVQLQQTDQRLGWRWTSYLYAGRAPATPSAN